MNCHRQEGSHPWIGFKRSETRRGHDEKSPEQRKEPAGASGNGGGVLLTVGVDRIRPIHEAREARMRVSFDASGDGRPAAHVVMENSRFTSWCSANCLSNSSRSDSRNGWQRQG